MPWKEVTEYGLQADFNDETYSLWLKFPGDDSPTVEVPINDATELAAVGDILRNERPCYYNEDTSLLTTGWEPTGEGEDT